MAVIINGVDYQGTSPADARDQPKARKRPPLLAGGTHADRRRRVARLRKHKGEL